MSHARGASQFSGDGAVMHCLADEIERMRHWMQRRILGEHFGNPDYLNEFDLYDLARQALRDGTLSENGKAFWPEHLR